MTWRVQRRSNARARRNDDSGYYTSDMSDADDAHRAEQIGDSTGRVDAAGARTPAMWRRAQRGTDKREQQSDNSSNGAGKPRRPRPRTNLGPPKTIRPGDGDLPNRYRADPIPVPPQQKQPLLDAIKIALGSLPGLRDAYESGYNPLRDAGPIPTLDPFTNQFTDSNNGQRCDEAPAVGVVHHAQSVSCTVCMKHFFSDAHES